MPRRIYTSEEKYNIIMDSSQNPDITVAAICRDHGIAVSLFYKCKEQFLYGEKRP
ncbi:MAG: transposase [Thermoplasmata archaeon]